MAITSLFTFAEVGEIDLTNIPKVIIENEIKVESDYVNFPLFAPKCFAIVEGFYKDTAWSEQLLMSPEGKYPSIVKSNDLMEKSALDAIFFCQGGSFPTFDDGYAYILSGLPLKAKLKIKTTIRNFETNEIIASRSKNITVWSNKAPGEVHGPVLLFK